MMEVDKYMRLNGSSFWCVDLNDNILSEVVATNNGSFYGGISQYTIQVANNCYKYATPEGWYPKYEHFDRYEVFLPQDAWKSEKRRRLEKEIMEILKVTKEL